MKPNDYKENAIGEIVKELMLNTAIRRTLIPKFLLKQVNKINDLMIQITTIMNIKL